MEAAVDILTEVVPKFQEVSSSGFLAVLVPGRDLSVERANVQALPEHAVFSVLLSSFLPILAHVSEIQNNGCRWLQDQGYYTVGTPRSRLCASEMESYHHHMGSQEGTSNQLHRFLTCYREGIQDLSAETLAEIY